MRPLTPSFERALGASTPARAIAEVRTRLAALQAQSATGRRIQRASDDPTAYAEARRLDALEARLGGYGEAVSAARYWSTQTASELDGMVELATKAHELGLQGANDTAGTEARTALADQLDALAVELVDRLNGRVGGEYLFGGHRSAEPPFNPDGTPTAPDLGGARRYRVGPTLELAANVDGNRVQDLGDGETAVGALQALAAALRADGPVPQDVLTAVAGARDHFIGLGAEVGTTLNRLDAAGGHLDAAGLDLARRRSDVQDADFYEVAMAMQQAQVQLEATLRTTASNQQRTLLDYLR